MKFIVDSNVGKLARWLRMVGYDTLFFDGSDDATMIGMALAEGRVILTRDTQIIKRRVVTSGRLKVILVASDDPEQQIRQVIDTLDLIQGIRPFTVCLECNVFQTQSQYVECTACHRIYWRGTHWQAMRKKLEGFTQS
jgi:uncharacterized protein with PIN domain